MPVAADQAKVAQEAGSTDPDEPTENTQHAPQRVQLTGEINYLRLRFDDDGGLMAGSLPYFVPLFSADGKASGGVIKNAVLDLFQISRSSDPFDPGIAGQPAKDGTGLALAVRVSVRRRNVDAVWIDSDRVTYPAFVDESSATASSYDSHIEDGGPFITATFLSEDGMPVSLDSIDVKVTTNSGREMSVTERPNEIILLRSVNAEALNIVVREKESERTWETRLFAAYRGSRPNLVLYTVYDVPVGREVDTMPDYAVRKAVSNEVAALMAACETASGTACYDVALRLQEGKGVTQNFAEAAEYLERACAFDHIEACMGAGIAHFRGEGVERNADTAIKFFEEACEQGAPRGCYNVGAFFHNEFVPADPEKEKLFFDKACELGMQEACDR